VDKGLERIQGEGGAKTGKVTGAKRQKRGIMTDASGRREAPYF
jgi:hypothetical protein